MLTYALIYPISGKRNDEEGAKEKLFTYASHVVVDSFKVYQIMRAVSYYRYSHSA